MAINELGAKAQGPVLRRKTNAIRSSVLGVSYGGMYEELTRMEKAGLVTHTEGFADERARQVRSGVPQQFWSLTDKGREELGS